MALKVEHDRTEIGPQATTHVVDHHDEAAQRAQMRGAEGVSGENHRERRCEPESDAEQHGKEGDRQCALIDQDQAEDCDAQDEAEQGWIMEAILGDLQRPSIPEVTITRLLRDVEDLGAQGAEAVILGCTDLPMAVTEENSPVPVLDTTRIHVNAIMNFAF